MLWSNPNDFFPWTIMLRTDSFCHRSRAFDRKRCRPFTKSLSTHPSPFLFQPAHPGRCSGSSLCRDCVAQRCRVLRLKNQLNEDYREVTNLAKAALKRCKPCFRIVFLSSLVFNWNLMEWSFVWECLVMRQVSGSGRPLWGPGGSWHWTSWRKMKRRPNTTTAKWMEREAAAWGIEVLMTI